MTDVRHQTKKTWPRCGLVWVAVSVTVAISACSSGGEKSVDFGPALAAVSKQIEPVADSISSSALEQYTPTNSLDSILDNVRQKYRTDIDNTNASICKTLQQNGKKLPSKDRADNFNRMVDSANSAISDVFVLELLEYTVAAPPDKQAELVKELPITGSSPDKTPLEGTDALKAARLLNAQGVVSIPPADSAEYVTYRDWLGNNPSFHGLIITLTADFTKALHNCYQLS